MSVKYSDFILEFYKRKTFREVSWPQFLQFCDDVKKDNLSKNQKLWRDYFLVRDPATGNFVTGPTGEYIRKQDPDPNISTNGEDWQLTDSEWEKMYNAFLDAFRGLNANKSKFVDNKKATDFLNKYFGQNASVAHVFDEIKVNQAAKDQINLLKTILSRPETSDVVTDLYNEGKLDIKDDKLDEILANITSEKYIKDEDFRNKLIRIAYHIQGLLSDNIDRTLGDKIRGLNLPLNLSLIYNDFEDTSIDPVRLSNFKGTYASMLNDLYKTKDIRTEFEKYDHKHIVQNIDSAKSYINYNDATNNPDDYITPKGDDELNFKQRVAKWWDNTFEGYLEKYVKLRGDRMFFSDYTKEIAKAFDKLKPPVKPTDGLAKILDSCDDASKGLMLKKSKTHLKWFKDNLKEIKAIMPKAFEGALQHGNQLRAIVAELIRRAVENDKVEEAKTAMELLSVMKYGMTTSKTMDALKKTDLTVFSDKNLSWNKNSEAMRFVSNAVDHSLRFAMLGIGYGITIAGNAYRLSGSKFNGNRGKILSRQQDREKQAAQANTDNLNASAQSEITNQTNTQNQTGITSAADLAIQKRNSLNYATQIQQYESGMTNAQNAIDGANNTISQLQQHRVLQQWNKLDTQAKTMKAQLTKITNEINRINTELAKPVYTTRPVSQENKLIAARLRIQLADLQSKHNMIETKRNAVIANRNALDAQKQNIEQQINAQNSIITQETNNFNTAKTNKDQAEQDKTALDGRISQYESAETKISELTQQINSRNNEMRNWDANHHDKYKELMAYWDMLETGRDSRTGVMYKWMPGNKKTHQANFDAHKAAIITNYANNYSIVA